MSKSMEEQLSQYQKQTLSAEEQVDLWNELVAVLPNQKSSWYLTALRVLIIKPMASIIIALVLLVSGSVATVAAADNAKPGDFLYPLDKGVEKVQLSLSSDKNKDKLKIKFATERVAEVKAVISDQVDSETQTENSTDENYDETNQNEASDDTQSDVVVEKVVNDVFTSLIDLQSDLDNKGNSEAVAEIGILFETLQQELEKLSGDIEFEQEGNKMKMEIKSDNGKVEKKIKIEDDGKVEIETKDENYDDEDNDESSESNKGLTEVEVKIYGEQAKVEVEYNNLKYRYTINSRERNIIADYIAERLEIDNEQISKIMRIEYEDDHIDTDNSSDDSLDNDSSSTDSSDSDDSDNSIDTTTIFKEIEIKVEHGEAEIKVKLLSGGEDQFKLSLTSQSEIYDYLANKYSTDLAQVSGIADFEFED